MINISNNIRYVSGNKCILPLINPQKFINSKGEIITYHIIVILFLSNYRVKIYRATNNEYDIETFCGLPLCVDIHDNIIKAINTYSNPSKYSIDYIMHPRISKLQQKYSNIELLD